MNKTTIEWVRNPDGSQGYTFNPITGCLGPKGDGVRCPYCYARKLANGRLRERYLANETITPYEKDNVSVRLYNSDEKLTDPFYPRFWKERLSASFLRVKPSGIFVCDMSDLFGIGIPDGWTRQVISSIICCPQHRFYLLTKQPQNLIKFSPFPENAWVGVTATDQEQYGQALLWLLNIEATVKYISLEPLLDNPRVAPYDFCAGHVDWLIIGAMTCSGGDLAVLSSKYPELTPMPYGNRYTLQPAIEWVKEIVSAADKAGIPVFLKDNLDSLLHGKSPFVGSIDIYSDDKTYVQKLRQEVPE